MISFFYFIIYFILLLVDNYSFVVITQASLTHIEEDRNNYSPINVIYSFSGKTHSSRALRSMKSIIDSASLTTLQRLNFFLFIDLWHTDNTDLKYINTTLDYEIKKISHEHKHISINVLYINANDIVSNDRTVWGNYAYKLNLPSNYVRFYLPSLLQPTIQNILYLDTDTYILDDISIAYDITFFDMKKGDFTMGAGVQSIEWCNVKKILLDIDTIEKLQKKQRYSLNKKSFNPNDVCLASGVMFINLYKWKKEDITEKLEYWLKQNTKKKLWNLGSLPPLMIEFNTKWWHVPSRYVYDMKGQLCCTTKKTPKSIILHPVKDLLKN